jgi:hypothetical protein
MSSSSSSSNRWTLALTVTLAVGAMGVCYYLWNTSKTSSSSSSSSDKKDVPPGGTKPATTTSTTASSGGPEDPAKRAEYEEAIRLAKKSMGSNDYAAAAERYGQAIALVEKHLPSCTKDVMTLYNNRSAMYEKAGDVEKALRDILVVLSLDPVHLKARVRRARIYEQQGKGYEALDDYVVTMFIERAKGLPPTTSQKADEVCKQVRAFHAFLSCPGPPTPPHMMSTHPSFPPFVLLSRNLPSFTGGVQRDGPPAGGDPGPPVQRPASVHDAAHQVLLPDLLRGLAGPVQV